MREDEDWLDEQLRDILSGGAARRKITPDRLREFEDRVAAKRRVGHDIAFQLRGAQLPRIEIMRVLGSSPIWYTIDAVDTERETMTGTKWGFTVGMVRHPDEATVRLHFIHVIDELYRLTRWDAYDALYPWQGNTQC